MSTQGKLPLPDPPSSPAERATDEKLRSRDPVAGTNQLLPSWLGLVTSHRRLFDASQDGWLHPPPSSYFVLGNESFVSEEISKDRSVVPVRLTFDVAKLPFPDARKDIERGILGNNVGDQPRVVHWPAPIPLYSVRTVEVPSSEQKARLLAMADQLSNVSLPDTEVAVSEFEVQYPAASGPATSESKSLELPESLNAIQGAMSMAVWSVPRVEPWIKVLQQALVRDAAGVAEGARVLDAQWLQIPWLVHHLSGPANEVVDHREQLWRSALRCMQWPIAADKSPHALAEKIARTACLDRTNRTVETWLDRTRRIISADETITCDGWRENGAGLAIRLALLRPEPIRFKSWNRDLPGLPPAVWWAAAIPMRMEPWLSVSRQAIPGRSQAPGVHSNPSSRDHLGQKATRLHCLPLSSRPSNARVRTATLL